jgi:prephenate dehydratase
VCSLPKDQPGGLYKILGLLQALNLTKIESRPSKDVLGSYYFFMDVQGNYSDPVIREVLANVKAKTDTFKILGVYKEITAC